MNPLGQKLYQFKKNKFIAQGFFIYNHLHEIDSAEEQLVRWIKDEKIKSVEHVVDGFMSMPEDWLNYMMDQIME